MKFSKMILPKNLINIILQFLDLKTFLKFLEKTEVLVTDYTLLHHIVLEFGEEYKVLFSYKNV